MPGGAVVTIVTIVTGKCGRNTTSLLGMPPNDDRDDRDDRSLGLREHPGLLPATFGFGVVPRQLAFGFKAIK